MAFYSGSANSFADLRQALLNACVAEGYSLASGVLSKGAVYVMPTTDANGILLQGGTGLASGALVDPSPLSPRLGRPNSAVNAPTWPVAYKIHINANPDEVFMVVRFNVDYFMWGGWGISTIPGLSGTGLWVTGNARQAQKTSGAGEVTISATSGGNGGGSNSTAAAACSAGLPFWWTAGQSVAGGSSDMIHAGIESAVWQGAAAGLNAVMYAAPLVEWSPSAWNSEAILLPIRGYVARPSSKISQVLDLRHARYVRIDNYEPEQIITLGPDRWIVYPGFRKSRPARNGGAGINHTGTFGFAVRYDGP